jgi:hypothetical protein
MSNITPTNTITDNVNFMNQTPTIQGLEPTMEMITHDGTVMTSLAGVTTMPFLAAPPYQGGERLDNVLEYMSRPQLIYNADFVNGVRTNFTGVSIDNSYYNRLTGGNAAGSHGIRATLCFRLDVSSPPQVGGIVKLAYLPFAPGFIGVDKTNYPTLCSQLSNAELNLAEGTSLEFKVPFIFDQDYWIFGASDRQGLLVGAAYVPLNWDPATTSTPTWSLYSWLEDVTLLSRRSASTIVVVPQAERAGPVSSIMSQSSRIVNIVGSMLPSLTSYTKPLAWVFQGVGSLAAQFGWSKPNDGTWKIMGTSFARGINTAMDVGQATELGYFANNEIQAMPGMAGTNVDEMSFCYLTCKPGALAAFNLSAADVRQTTKWSCQVNPNKFTFYTRSDFAGFAQPPPPSYTQAYGFLPTPIFAVAQYFNGWRGDLVFRFKFARTKFHGGKVLIGYNPKPNSAAGEVPDDLRYNFNSVLVDLRTTSEIDLLVPYTFARSFCNIGNGFENAENTGNVFMNIIEPLTAPAGVVSIVPVIIEVFAKDGLEFTAPCSSGNAYMPPGYAAIAQSERCHTEDLGGECILSVKQLLMRPSWAQNRSATAPALDDYWWGTQMNYPSPPPSAWITSSPCTRFADIVNWYAMWRGSTINYFMPSTSNRTLDISWRNTFFDGAAVSSETNIITALRRPFYATHNRLRTPYCSQNTYPPGYVQKLFNVNEFGNNGAYVPGIAAGDDFQLASFTGIPPFVRTYKPTNWSQSAIAPPPIITSALRVLPTIDELSEAPTAPQGLQPVALVQPPDDSTLIASPVSGLVSSQESTGGFIAPVPPEGAISSFVRSTTK